MVGVVSSIPCGGNFIFADFETPRCQFCTKLPEMSDLCYLGKTRVGSFVIYGLSCDSLCRMIMFDTKSQLYALYFRT